MKGLVISDTGPLISLDILGQVDLLETLFDQVIIPKAVALELAGHRDFGRSEQVLAFVQSITREIEAPNYLQKDIDFGESEAIILPIFRFRTFVGNHCKMEMQIVELEFPANLPQALGETDQEFKKRIRLATAIELFRDLKVSIGKAAQLSGLSRYEFENELYKREIPLSLMTYEDVMEDIRKLEDH